MVKITALQKFATSEKINIKFPLLPHDCIVWQTDKKPRILRVFFCLFSFKILYNIIYEKEQIFFCCRIRLVDIFNALAVARIIV